MRELYRTEGFAMDKVILLGNSMGGLVAAAYCTTSLVADKVKVAALISISTPWKGSHLGDLFCSPQRFPEKYFRRSSGDRERLVKSFSVPVYNYGSIFDLHVTTSSAQLEEVAPAQHRLIDSRNDHLTTMLDFGLARHIRDKWVRPNTEDLPALAQ
jgi:pimeloyl-ACP methyl ester carboxylesterase